MVAIGFGFSIKCWWKIAKKLYYTQKQLLVYSIGRFSIFFTQSFYQCSIQPSLSRSLHIIYRTTILVVCFLFVALVRCTFFSCMTYSYLPMLNIAASCTKWRIVLSLKEMNEYVFQCLECSWSWIWNFKSSSSLFNRAKDLVFTTLTTHVCKAATFYRFTFESM